MIIDNFTEGSQSLTVDLSQGSETPKPLPSSTNLVTGLSAVYGGQRRATLTAQGGIGVPALTIGSGSAVLNNGDQSQALVTLEWNVSGLSLTGSNAVRVNGTGAPDFTAVFTDAAGRTYEKGGPLNTLVTLSNAWTKPYRPTAPNWSTMQTLTIIRGGPLGTDWTITSVEIL